MSKLGKVLVGAGIILSVVILGFIVGWWGGAPGRTTNPTMQADSRRTASGSDGQRAGTTPPQSSDTNKPVRVPPVKINTNPSASLVQPVQGLAGDLITNWE